MVYERFLKRQSISTKTALRFNILPELRNTLKKTRKALACLFPFFCLKLYLSMAQYMIKEKNLAKIIFLCTVFIQLVINQLTFFLNKESSYTSHSN